MARVFAFLGTGLLSFIIYISLIVSFAYIYLDSIFTPEKYSITTKTAMAPIEVSLVSPAENRDAKDEVEDEVSEKSGSSSPKKSSVDKNLFQTLDSYDKPQEQTPLSYDDKKASRLKGESTKAKKSAKDALKNLNLKEIKTDNLNIKSTLGESDPYYDKILKILSRWTPGSTQTQMSSVVRLVVKQSGLYSFSIEKSSGDVDFDRSITYFLEDIASMPSHKKSRDVIIEVIFKTKD
ncbi:MAG: TonB C-terminal domain-containing protein [Campylobacterales bacterium]